MKLWKFIPFLAVAGLASAAFFGLAAPMGVDADPLGDGGADVMSCDDSGVQVHWNIQWNNAQGTHVVGFANISGIDSACIGGHIVVTLTHNGTWLAQKGGTISGDPFVADWSGDLDTAPKAADVTDVHVAIAGPSP